MRVALRVDVTSLQGIKKGVPTLLGLFQQYKVKASFYFSPGLETNPLFNRLLKRQALLAETMADIVKQVHAHGHDVGITNYHQLEWVKKAAFAKNGWSRSELENSLQAFIQATGVTPISFSASGFQVNSELFRFEDARAFAFASDTRGKLPFYPELQGVRASCIQIPVTLPTLHQALTSEGVNKENAHEYIYAESCYVMPAGHVYALNAEQEGIDGHEYMEKLLVMWSGQEGQIRSLGDVYNELDKSTVPVHQVGWDKVPGSQRYLATQSVKVS